ncbi:transporter substrate-binding domain-containing protein [Aestuariibacter sp. AA17]|uniref:Transporter substrate-binding domain-containing protein n=1 Tax=Fluctibacter corallii TaxID=2984329 RepID=A0ABT3A4D4_9ALTE|nr:transporter substrate-binding domain-containing protein [Aestuariibacter sp. AA17]MCV2883540.1 transporter substrate-binding domain-containing protein [Aestuariibacter sp. AA17]
MTRYALFLLILSHSFHVMGNTYIYTSYRGSDDQRSYFVEALKLALEKTQHDHGDYRIEPAQMHMNQERQIVAVQQGLADVMWTMTTDEREEKLLPVRFPLLKGYVGKRVLVIHRSREKEFGAKRKKTELQKKLAVQGLNWPDSIILSHNQFNVQTVDWGMWYENMFKLLAEGKADYFPRSIIEVHQELSRLRDPNFVISQYHLIEYPAFIYFFVSNDKRIFAKRLLTGLKRAKQSGELQTLFESFPEHQRADELITRGFEQHYRLENPLLTVKPVGFKNWRAKVRTLN